LIATMSAMQDAPWRCAAHRWIRAAGRDAATLAGIAVMGGRDQVACPEGRTTGSNGRLRDMAEIAIFPPAKRTRGLRHCSNGTARAQTRGSIR